ncbi:hypothetical protein SAMN04488693_101315 [Arthrobacter subterraneus]|uniref:WXG100 family type VII secretion target n=2 Tax=Arthrobacter subterraneus TaxID=335973 RepID=A0A1G8CLZ4_9MICC|nr:hypothetical protein SAMN04488693_101315 [Arthrobacter subterraneus]
MGSPPHRGMRLPPGSLRYHRDRIRGKTRGTMTGTLGANPDQLRSLAQHCGTGAQSLLDISAGVSAVINNPGFWKGSDADRTRQQWNTVLRLQILSASASLDRAKSELLEQAADQERTSSDADGPGGPGGSGGPGGPGMTPAGWPGQTHSPGEDANVPGPDWLLGPDSPFRDGWDIYQLIKAFPNIRAGLFDIGAMLTPALRGGFLDPTAWTGLRSSNMLSGFFNTSSDLFDGNWHTALNLTEGSRAFAAFDGLGKGLGVVGTGLDLYDTVVHWNEGDKGAAAYSGVKTALGIASFAPPPVGTVAMVASGALAIYDNVPVVQDAVNAVGGAIADTAGDVGGAIADGADAVGDFFGF